jgi:predicted MFS family arabinose efflux permease
MIVLPRWGWRAVFFVGVLPAFFTLWVRRHVREPRIWLEARQWGPAAAASPHPPPARPGDVFRGPLLRLTVPLTLMNACTMFAWWGYNLWLPGYLSLPAAAGGLGFRAETMTLFIAFMQVGMWFGYVTFGFISDAVGRRRAYVGYTLTAAALILLYTSLEHPLALFLLGPLVAFFGTGYFSGFGAVTAEVYPTAIRATAQGLTYNIGRIASAAAPFTVGTLAQTHGFRTALSVTAAAFVAAAVAWRWIPETRGRELI